jgi:hypothetical protein
MTQQSLSPAAGNGEARRGSEKLPANSETAASAQAAAELEQQIRKTYPGQAHWAGTGPFAATCGDCEFLGYFKQIQTPAGNTTGTRRAYGCAVFRRLTGTHGPTVPRHAEACRHFARRAD